MGTPEFSKKIMKELICAGFEICAAVSQPDRKKGRGHKIQATPVKEFAEEKNIPVYQPEVLKDGAFKEILEKHAPQAIVVAAYGKILPEYIINYPEYGCINVHASLLPEYRGAAPIQRAIMDGREETGVTIMKMDKGLDTGDMLYRVKTKIGEYETSGGLFERLADMGAEALVHTLRLIESGGDTAEAQDEKKATYAKMITKADAEIDWNNSARKVSKLICAMLPSPEAFTHYNGETVKIIEAQVGPDSGPGAKPGDILACRKGSGIEVKCAEGTVMVKKIKMPGKKSMTVDDYINGKGILTGRFE